jgi:hypothetical protein
MFDVLQKLQVLVSYFVGHNVKSVMVSHAPDLSVMGVQNLLLVMSVMIFLWSQYKHSCYTSGSQEVWYIWKAR